jgi:hypothetical protein
MSRIRTTKPEFYRHEGLFEAEKESGLPLRVAYPGLWTVADREGRFRWRPRELKLDCLPYDDIDFADVLAALEKAGFIVGYEVDGQRYGWIPSFHKHQVINQREAPSKLPPVPAGDALHTQGPAHAQDKPVHAHAETVRAPDEHCGELEGELEREKKDSELRSAPAAPPKYADAKHELWHDGVIILQQLGKEAKLARSMIGKWLKETGDDAPQVLAAIRRAREMGTPDPIPFVTGALKVPAARQKPDSQMEGLQRRWDRSFGGNLAEAA